MAVKKAKAKKKPSSKKSAPKKAFAKKSQARKPARAMASKKAAAAKPRKAAKRKAAAKPAKVSAAPKTRKSATPQRARSQRPRASVNGVHRRDRAGHLDPRYAADLHAKSREGQETSTEDAFIRKARAHDDLAEEMGEGAVETMTTGEDEGSDDHEQVVTEELGGPFVESSANNEFADGSDESNPADATREPFPKT
jgi:hypothetical protein